MAYSRGPYQGPSRTSSYGSSDVTERVVSLNRVAKVVKGGRKFSFSALIVVGDMNGRVGAGLGKAREVPEAIRKGVEIAKRNMVTVPMVGTTIPHEVNFKSGAAKVLLKPASPGTGVISGGSMRAVIELAGVKDILTKSLGTNNPINTVRATIAALQIQDSPRPFDQEAWKRQVMRGKQVSPPDPLPQSGVWESPGRSNSNGRSESGLSSDALPQRGWKRRK